MGNIRSKTRLIQKNRDSNASLVLKVIGWRIFSFVVGSIVSYLYLGELRSSINLIAILTVVLTICHYFYEKIWLYSAIREKK